MVLVTMLLDQLGLRADRRESDFFSGFATAVNLAFATNHLAYVQGIIEVRLPVTGSLLSNDTMGGPFWLLAG
jgi:hypothetical protein